MTEEMDTSSTPKRDKSARSAADEPDDQQQDSVPTDNYRTSSTSSSHRLSTAESTDGIQATTPSVSAQQIRAESPLFLPESSPEPAHRQSDPVNDQSSITESSSGPVSGSLASQSETSPALPSTPNSNSKKRRSVTRRRNTEDQSADQQTPPSKKKKTSSSGKARATKGKAYEQNQNSPETPATALSDTPTSSSAQDVAPAAPNDSKTLSAKQKGKLPRRGGGQPTQAPTPTTTPQQTITLDALTPPYQGTANITQAAQGILQQIQAQMSPNSSRPTRNWLAQTFPRNEFVQGGYLAFDSSLWEFWMDTRFFPGPVWWYLATGNRRRFPIHTLGNVVPIVPGSIQPALNRGDWPATHIYSAPALTNYSAASTGPPATAAPQPQQPLASNNTTVSGNSQPEQPDQDEAEDPVLERVLEQSRREAETGQQQDHNGENGDRPIASSSRDETTQDDNDASDAAGSQRSTPPHWHFDCICGLHGDRVDDGTASMACEDCGIWKHVKCLGYTIEEAQRDGFKYFCPRCRSSQDQGRQQDSTIFSTSSNKQAAESEEDRAKQIAQDAEMAMTLEESPEVLRLMYQQLENHTLESPSQARSNRLIGMETDVGGGLSSSTSDRQNSQQDDSRPRRSPLDVAIENLQARLRARTESQDLTQADFDDEKPEGEFGDDEEKMEDEEGEEEEEEEEIL